MIKRLIKRTLNLLGYQISKIGNEEFYPFREMQRLFKETSEPIIFDVGACHGDISILFRNLFPSSTVYAFEPFPESFVKLKMTTSCDPNIKIFNLGFSDTEGDKLFHSNLSSVTNSLLESDPRASDTWGKGLLETKELVKAHFTTIDSFVKDINIPRIDILKLDVQGAENLVMKGAKESCLKQAIEIIYSEFITQPTYKNQLRFDEMLHEFYTCGFDLHNIYNMVLTSKGKLSQIDVIFTRNSKNK